MYSYLPKKFQGWRKVAGEISIIVVGVIIALFLEQIVERSEWQSKVDAAEASMMRELFWDNAPQMYQRVSIQPCINAQLDAIRSAVEAGKPRSEIGALVDRLYVPFVTYDSVAHDQATSAAVSSHMRKERLALWTQAYAMIPMVDAASAQESADLGQVKAFKRRGGQLDIQEELQLLSAVEAVRQDGKRIGSGVDWTMRVLPQLDGTLDPVRMKTFIDRAHQYYGRCSRDLPADWPMTPFPPLPEGIAPGLRADA